MLHLDWTDYAETLLGPADWTDAASIAALFGKAQALLPSDLIVLPLARIAAAHVAARAGLHSAVAAKPAEAQPLRALLGDTRLREMLVALVTRLRPALAAATLALGVPAPVAFAHDAAIAAGLPAPPPSDDLADDAAVYIADFLRVFAAAPLGALVLGESEYPEFDAPVVRVAEHYGWRVLRRPLPPRHFGEGRNPASSEAPPSEPLTQLGSGLRRNDELRTIIIPPDTLPEDAAALVARLKESA